MFYPTYIDDDTVLYLETETSGAFAKSDLEVRPDPGKAIVNSIALAETTARYLSKVMRPMMDEMGMDADVEFAIKADGHGTVMISKATDLGQFKFKLVMRK